MLRLILRNIFNFPIAARHRKDLAFHWEQISVLQQVMAALILLVHADVPTLRRLESLLSKDYLVTTASSFQDAQQLLQAVSPDLLIADIRLESFNGLHLAVRSRFDHPSRPIIITHAFHDPVLESEARRQGALFVVNPLDDAEFVQRVHSTLERNRHTQTTVRRWPRKRAFDEVEAQTAAARAVIADMSYGGLRLVFETACDVPSTFDVMLPGSGIRLRAYRVWTGWSATNDFQCGAELAEIGTLSAWRDFVDAVAGEQLADTE